MAVVFLEPGGDSDFGINLWPATGSGGTNPSVATDFVHGGHIKSISYAKSAYSVFIGSNFVTDAGGRISIYIYLNALPGADATIMNLEQTGDGNGVAGVGISSAGVLFLFQNLLATKIGSTGSTLSTGVWYRLTFCWTIASAISNEFRLFKNNVSDISVSNAVITNTSSADLQLGNASADATYDLRTSDHYIDNSTALTDPASDIWVTAKRPNANGTANGFTTQIGAGGSGYGTGHSPQVNERANSDTNGWSLSNTTKATEEYNIEAAGTGDIDISAATIIDYMGWLRSSVNSTANSPVHHIIVNGVATTITEATTTKMFTKVAGSTSYPAGTGTDIGIDAQYTTTAHLTRLFECGVNVAYTPGVVGATQASGSRMLLGGVGQ